MKPVLLLKDIGNGQITLLDQKKEIEVCMSSYIQSSLSF